MTMAPTGVSQKTDTAQVVAGCALGVGACAAYMALPVLLGIIADSAKLSDQQVGWLGSVELGGMMVGALLLTVFIRPNRVRLMAAIALLAVIAGVLGLRVAHTFNEIAIARGVGGIGAGLGNSLAIVTIGYTRLVARNQGWLNAAIIVCGGLELTAFGMTSASYGLDGAVWPILAISLAALAAVPFLATSPTQAALAASDGAGAGNAKVARMSAGILGAWLLCITLGQMAPAGAYAYAERLALEMGINAATSGPILTAGALLSALACLAAWRLSARIGSPWCTALCVGGLVVVLGSWAYPSHDIASYAARAILTTMFWAVLTVYQVTAMVELSSNPRWLSLVPTAQNLGLALGPALGASFVGEAGTLSHAMASCAALMVVPFVIVTVIANLSKARGQRS